MRKIKLIITMAVVAMATTVAFTNCTSGSSTSNGGSSSSLSSFASVLSEDMVLSSPTSERTGTSVLSVPVYSLKNDILIMEAPSADDSPKEKKDALEAMLAREAPSSCAIALNIHNSGRANCYGPSVSYVLHEFDSTSGTWPGGDLGIWQDTETSGEACVAAQLNSQMKGVLSYVDVGQFITAGMACVANKKGESLPAEGSTLDLTSDMASIVTVNSQALTVTSATIKREANDGSGNPVYVSTLSGTTASSSYFVRLKHISTSSDDSTNKGKISVKVSATSPSSTDGVSLEYEKSSSTSGKFQLKKINFSSSGSDPFASSTDYTVSYAKSWNNNADYFIAELDPSTYAGKYAYAWQAGSGDSHSRVFNTILNVSGSTVSGTAFYGYGPKMQVGPGAISGMICAWTGPDVSGPTSRTVHSKVQRQDLNLSSGKFTLSGTSHTTYDPVVNCEANSASMTLTWNSGSNTRNVASTTENLVSLSIVSSTIGALPTAPTNVD